MSKPDSVQHYWKKKLVNQNLTVEYSSEDGLITITFEHKLNNGTSIGTDHLEIHPSYVEPLHELLTNVTKKDAA